MAKKKNNNISNRLCSIVIGLAIIFIIGFETYRMISSYIIRRTSDNQWPTRDLTSVQYSGSYDGIDISRHQGRIHWDELGKIKRLKFVYVKSFKELFLLLLRETVFLKSECKSTNYFPFHQIF